LPPALLAEQQRAKSEIEAALTLAAHMPRDEKQAMDGILVSCQRKGLAEKAQYQYSRGGTSISGPSIVLMEAIAQRWGNIDFGFRELSRYPGRGNQPGESVVEAYAWDLETNTRRKVVFQVEHAMTARGKKKLLTDPRDVYEYVANQAQRRVRTCLENIIPRDIVDSACEECDRTLKAEIQDVADAAKKMLAAFTKYNVTQAMIEGRIQRRIDAITPAQIIGMKKIYASLSDGMSEPADWFDVSAEEKAEEPQTAAEKVKEAMRKKAAAEKKPQPEGNAKPAPKPAPKTEPKKPAAPAPQEKPDGGKKEAPAKQTPTPEKPTPSPPETANKDGGAGDGAHRDEPGSAESDAVSGDPATDGAGGVKQQEPENPEHVEQAAQWIVDLESVNTITPLNDALAAIPKDWAPSLKQQVCEAIKKKIAAIHDSRGERSNKPKGGQSFDNQASATEQGV